MGLFPGMWDLPSPGMEPRITCIGRTEDSLPPSHLGSTDDGGVAGIVKEQNAVRHFVARETVTTLISPLPCSSTVRETTAG